MASKNKPNVKILRKLMFEKYHKELEELKARGKEGYRPKYGRKMKQLQKKLSRLG